MPRLRQNAEKDALKDFVAEINAQRGRFGYKSQKSLGEALGVCQATAGNYIKSPETIPIRKLREMIKILQLDPVVVLKALGYSTREIKNINARAAEQ